MLLPANILFSGSSLTGPALGIWLIPKVAAIPTTNRLNSSIPTKNIQPPPKSLPDLEREPLKNLFSDSIQEKTPYTQAQIECAEKLGLDPSECDSKGFQKALLPPSDTTVPNVKRDLDYTFSPSLPPKLAVTFEYFPKKANCWGKTSYQETTPNLTAILQPAIDYWNNARIQANIALNRLEKQALIGLLKHPFSEKQLTIPIGLCNCPDLNGLFSANYICLDDVSSRVVAHEFGHIFGFEHPTHNEETVMRSGDLLISLEYFPCNIDPLHPLPTDIDRMKKNELPILAHRIKTKGDFRTVEGELNPPNLETCVFSSIEHLIGRAFLRQTPGFVITLLTTLACTLLASKITKHIPKNHPHLQKLSYLPGYILYVALSFGINGPLFGSISGAMILGTTLIQKSLDIPSIKKTVYPAQPSPIRQKLFNILNHPVILPLFFSICISTGVFGSQFKSLPSIPSVATLVTESVLIVPGFITNLIIGVIMGFIIENCYLKALNTLNNNTKMIQNDTTNLANAIDLPETISAL